MTADDVINSIFTMNPYRLADEGGNRVCCFCGYFRDFTQRDPKLGPSTHSASCVWAAVRVLKEQR